jgi:ferredoxin-NADP reductase
LFSGTGWARRSSNVQTQGAIALIYETRLVSSEPVAEGTMAFHFERPRIFTFRSGQNVMVTLIDPPESDDKGPSRIFTLASAPHEPRLSVATRMRDSAFKRVLKTAAPGLRVKIDGPDGTMTLHGDPARPAVFLAGGIGITPFLSMARDAAFRKLPHRIVLFYSNRRPEDAAFLSELQNLEQANPNFRLVATIGFIQRKLLESHLPDLAAPIYYMAGPPAMTTAMQSMLAECGVAEGDTRFEEFYGY